jgi:hypothetical protein
VSNELTSGPDVEERRWMNPLKRINHNTVLFTAGLLGVGHETLIQHAERPTLLILFAAMMGLPAFLNPATPGEVSFKDRKKPSEKVVEVEVEVETEKTPVKTPEKKETG